METSVKERRAKAAHITAAKALVRPEYAKYVDKDSDMYYINQQKEEIRQRNKAEMYTPPNKQVGSFGIVTDAGEEILYHWSISGERTDKRHGVLDEPVSLSRHAKQCFEDMFRGWK